MNEYLRKFEIINDLDPLSRSNRHIMVTKYSWAVPNDKALRTIAKYSPIVEIGCGTAYWAHLLQGMGCKVLPFDKYRDDNPYGHTKNWTTVFEGDSEVLHKLSHSINLFLCWPPYNEDMALNCLKNFKGKYLLYIGEGHYGCTASDEFFHELDANWMIEDTVYLPNWDSIYDNLYIYKRY